MSSRSINQTTAAAAAAAHQTSSTAAACQNVQHIKPQHIRPPAAHQTPHPQRQLADQTASSTSTQRPACLKTSSTSSRSSNHATQRQRQHINRGSMSKHPACQAAALIKPPAAHVVSNTSSASRGSTSDHPQQIKPHPPRQKSNLTTRSSTLKRSAHVSQQRQLIKPPAAAAAAAHIKNLINRGSMCQNLQHVKPQH